MGDLKFPSVTKVLERYSPYGNIRQSVLEKAQVRGTAVHSGCFTICRGLPLFPEPPEGYLLRIESFQRWFDANVDEVLEIEPELVDSKLRFLGHPDLILVCKNLGLCLADIKTAEAHQPIWVSQLSAYFSLTQTYGRAIDRVFSLMLDSGGGLPKIVPLEHPGKHFSGFFHALMAHHYFTGMEVI